MPRRTAAGMWMEFDTDTVFNDALQLCCRVNHSCGDRRVAHQQKIGIRRGQTQRVLRYSVRKRARLTPARADQRLCQLHFDFFVGPHSLH